MYKTRSKRDTAENLYRHCKATGNCPPDVENKIEGNTLADRLLRIFGSVIYLGGLGLGTGEGTTGIRPIEAPVETVRPDIAVETPTVRPRPQRPTTFGTPIDRIGSADISPNVVKPTESSIVPLNESGIPDPTIIDSATGGGEGLGEYDILTTVDPNETLGATGGHPTTSGALNNETAILDISPYEPPPKRFALAPSVHAEADITIIESSLPTESNINVFVDANITGEIVGEEIPLDPINSIEEFEIEAGRQTSTPREAVERFLGRARSLYNRYIQQIRTENVDFLTRPSRAVQFEFENPAFTGDVSLEFARDVAEITAAPDPDFADIIRLGRPIFSETPGGTVRVSRLGTKGAISTRSGTIIGPRVHYYFDLSAIEPIEPDVIELSNLGEFSGESTIVDSILSGHTVDPIAPFESTFSIADLEDPLLEDFSNSHLFVHFEEEDELIAVPTLPPGAAIKAFVDDYADIIVSYPEMVNVTKIEIPATTLVPSEPHIRLDWFSPDYDLHPSLLRRRRKRKRNMF